MTRVQLIKAIIIRRAELWHDRRDTIIHLCDIIAAAEWDTTYSVLYIYLLRKGLK